MPSLGIHFCCACVGELDGRCEKVPWNSLPRWNCGGWGGQVGTKKKTHLKAPSRTIFDWIFGGGLLVGNLVEIQDTEKWKEVFCSIENTVDTKRI